MGVCANITLHSAKRQGKVQCVAGTGRGNSDITWSLAIGLAAAAPGNFKN